MKARVGFTIILSLIYFALALKASFGLTSVDFWSGVFLSLGLMSVLPIGILSIWKPKIAGRMLIVVAAVVVCSIIFEIHSHEEVGGLVIALPIVFSGMLLLKKSPSEDDCQLG